MSPNVEDSLEREEVVETDYPYYTEWSEKMGNFHPKSLVNLTIDAKSTELFYESVTKQPTTIKGMFYTQSRDDYLGVFVTVKSPISKCLRQNTCAYLFLPLSVKNRANVGNEVLYSHDAPEGFFSLEAKMVGNYEIALTNSHWMTPVYVTFATGTDDHSILKSEHVENTFNRVKKLEEHIDNIYSQFRYFWTHNNRQMIATKKAQGRLLLYAVLQFSIILICSVVSLWYVKRSVSNKRIL
ncbi:conserved hypothetical protein [Theileria orientalis strain Shintoku]|uniref:GOLD domain-containing protein n=1 Tax=Theileria orientalis strain Shintoku TaxID=869250 RepID=J4C2K1_THEOR|nr:conserved hypothetical protein [Theileria orientalis strain Shintoku]BAM38831.1 conserved hypothetical protein [Theileria orientalis strain Shintoku]|eukprot:XP_009689132.1 conserved hypothetical protein [Theileria orientalis strain Shintoku]